MVFPYVGLELSFHRTRRSSVLKPDIQFDYKRNTLGPRCGRGASLGFSAISTPLTAGLSPFHVAWRCLATERAPERGLGSSLGPWMLHRHLIID
jgi:hypothetical protein